MKCYYDLWSKITTRENFELAYKRATKGKKYYKEVKCIERKGWRRYVNNLRKEVINKTYKVSDYNIFNLFTGGKWREIYKLPMKDRIVQHAIMNYLEPVFRETFILDTFASIKGRGIHLGLKRVKKALKRNPKYKYYLKLDIHKCYPSLDKNILKDKLKCKIKDENLLWLLFEIIDSCDNGVPIGNYTSQYFNNFYFNDFDHWIKEVKHIKAYFRYCDDIIILAETKEELRELLKEIKVEIEKLNVKIKPNWQIYNIDVKGIDFLGYIIRRYYIRIRKITKQNFINKVKSIDVYNLNNNQVNVLGSYWGILRHCNGRNLWFKYIGMKTFEELNVKVHEREFVKNIVDKQVIVTGAVLYYKRGEKRVKLSIKFNQETTDEIYVSTGAEMIIEVIEHLKITDYPFITTIQINSNGYFKFT